MAERPILFNGEMVRAILDERKTQTRRVVMPQPPAPGRVHALTGTADIALYQSEVDGRTWRCAGSVWAAREIMGCEPVWRCPYGEPGDRLWVRETWAAPPYCEGMKPRDMHAEHTFVYYRADGETGNAGSWRPSIHMPRWASRLTLRVTEVRVERVQDISAEDARAEGCIGHDPEPSDDGGTVYAWGGRSSAPDPRAHFAHLWDAINGPRGFGWDANPWVWVVSLEREGAACG